MLLVLTGGSAALGAAGAPHYLADGGAEGIHILLRR
jgi:hypothetical protein